MIYLGGQIRLPGLFFFFKSLTIRLQFKLQPTQINV